MQAAFEEPNGSWPTSDLADLAAAAALWAEQRKSYAQTVSLLVDQVSAERREVTQWLKKQSPGKTICDHMADVLSAGGIIDTASRLTLVGAAARRQQQRLQECSPAEVTSPRSGRHRQRHLVSAITAATTMGERHSNKRAAAKPLVKAPLSTPTEAGPSSDGRTWVRIEAFTTCDEAVSFVHNCQPFEYRPVKGEVPLEIEDHAVDVEPIEFLSAGGDFKRRLRIRKQDLSETRPQSCEASSQRQRSPTPGSPSSFGGSHAALRRSPALTRTPPPQRVGESKPWIVEGSGALFERPESLRALRTMRGPVPRRYFVAVAEDIERRVLTEGFRVQRRCSIPCAATPKDALLAWQSVQRVGQQAVRVRPSVLTVTLPPNIDVVSNHDGAFRIKARELPAYCFTRCRRPGSEP